MFEHASGILIDANYSHYRRIRDKDLPNPAGSYFIPVLGPLFHQVPTTNDIHQSGLGDCALLAALLCIVETNPKYPPRFMRDLHNGWVLVRLFDDNKQPIYFELQKTYLFNPIPTASFTRHTGAWVYLIEKAYAVYQLLFGGACYKPPGTNTEAIPNDYQQALYGGQSAISLQRLLGISSVVHDILPKKVMNPNAKELAPLSKDIKNVLAIGIHPENPIYLSPSEQTSFQKIFGILGNTESIQTAIDDFLINAKQNQTGSEIFLRETQRKGALRANTLLDHLAEYYPNLQPNTQAALEAYILQHLAHKRGAGHYSDEQIENYRYIFNRLNTGGLVCISSANHLGTLNEFNNLDNLTIKQSKGLTGPHAYQVINCYERTGLRFLLLRNPWQHYVREYRAKIKTYYRANRAYDLRLLSAHTADHRSAQRVRPQSPLHYPAIAMSERKIARLLEEHGVFELEISDLSKRFVTVHSCQPTVWR